MLPPALGGLRVSRAAGPGPPCTREYGKDQLPCGFPQDGEIILHPPFRRQIANIKKQDGEIRLRRERNRDTFAAGKRAPRRCAPTRTTQRMCRVEAEGVFRCNAISRESPVHQRQVGGMEPTVAREHVCGPDVISTTTVNGAREGARVEIMSVGCPQTAGRASRSGQVPDYLSRNIPSADAPPLYI